MKQSLLNENKKKKTQIRLISDYGPQKLNDKKKRKYVGKSKLNPEQIEVAQDIAGSIREAK